VQLPARPFPPVPGAWSVGACPEMCGCRVLRAAKATQRGAGRATMTAPPPYGPERADSPDGPRAPIRIMHSIFCGHVCILGLTSTFNQNKNTYEKYSI